MVENPTVQALAVVILIKRMLHLAIQINLILVLAQEVLNPLILLQFLVVHVRNPREQLGGHPT
jgi:hypothetical protein